MTFADFIKYAGSILFVALLVTIFLNGRGKSIQLNLPFVKRQQKSETQQKDAA